MGGEGVMWGLEYRRAFAWLLFLFSFFFFNDTATTEIYTLSLHDALPISLTHCLEAGITAESAEQLQMLAGQLAKNVIALKEIGRAHV